MAAAQLFDSDREKRRGGKALERLNPARCPECQDKLQAETVGEPALFFHGGYGALRQTSTLHCPTCGWTMVSEISEVRP